MKFRSMYCNPKPKVAKDYHNEFIKQFIELEPFAVDDKGVLLNDSKMPKLKEIEPLNIYEQIQSYKRDTDIYLLLDRLKRTGDQSILNVNTQGVYADISDIPQNPIDARDFSYNALTRAIADNEKNKMKKENDYQNLDLFNTLVKKAVAEFVSSQKPEKENEVK